MKAEKQMRTTERAKEANMQLRKSSFIPSTGRASGRPSGFTLVELLVVIAIIAVLIGITIPIVGKVRKSSQEAATRSLIGQIDSACQAYYGDFNAYPGPMSSLTMTQSEQYLDSASSELFDAAFSQQILSGAPTPGVNGFGAGVKRLTGTENLVLGLMGGLQYRTSDAKYGFNKDQMGLGPVKFNPKRPGRANAYMQPTNLSDGKFTDDAGLANPSKDSEIPEFIDSFSNPMPVLYLRARKGGAAGNINNISNTDNHVVTDQITADVGQYNLLEIAAYTQSSIGVGKSIKPGDYKNHQGTPVNQYPHGLISIDKDATLGSKTSASQYPYNAYAYLREPDVGGTDVKLHRARKQDAFILISAGIDRVYGTEDDITNFGSVLP